MLRIDTLGTFRVTADDRPLDWIRTQRQRAALLVFLAVEGEMPRDRAASVFWPDSAPDRARRALNQAVYDLRRRVGEDRLLTIGDSIRPGDDIRVDARSFLEACQDGRDADALALYGGAFLEDVHLVETAEFEQWVERKSAELKRRHRQIRRNRLTQLIETGDLAAALAVARKWIAIDPLEDEAHHRLIELLAATGHRTEALDQFDAYARLMRAQDLAPLDETEAVVASLRAGEAGPVSGPIVAIDLIPAGARSGEESGTAPTGAGTVAARAPASPSQRWRLRRRSAWLAGIAGLALVTLAGARILSRGWHPAEDRLPEDASPAIAVLPFEVRGPGTEGWSEGMVTLLSTGLDGVGGLRSVPSRTILAAWDRIAKEGSTIGPDRALDVAFSLDARYAVIGSAVAIGPSIRLVADLYGVRGAERRRTVQVEGSVDEILSLVDRLALGILGVLLENNDVERKPNMAALTTASLPALKAFLAGEQRHRRSDFDGAVRAYADAVRADPEFALAWLRLNDAWGWLGTNSEARTVVDTPLPHVLRLRDRLPVKERLFFRAQLENPRADPEAIERARELTMRWPDAADAWYQLGEIYYHEPAALASYDEAARAFRNAVRLEPDFAPYGIHLVDIAFQDHPDSARIAREMERYVSVAGPANVESRSFRLALDLGFGDPPTRARAISALDTIGVDIILWALLFGLEHPRFQDSYVRLIETWRERGERTDLIDNDAFYHSIFAGGGVREALTSLGTENHGSMAVCRILLARELLAVDPAGRMAALMALGPSDSIVNADLWCKGLYAADHGRYADVERVVSMMQGERAASADTAAIRALDAELLALEAWADTTAEAVRGSLAALEKSATFFGTEGEHLFFRIAMLHERLGEYDEALKHLRAIRLNPLAWYHQARIQERVGDRSAAREGNAAFLEAWRSADPEFQPLLADARSALTRLNAAR